MWAARFCCPGEGCDREEAVEDSRRSGGVAPRPRPADPGMAIGDVAVSDPHAPAYLSAAARGPRGCVALRESAKRSRHEADVVRAGGHFVPLVYDTYGTMGEGAEAWFPSPGLGCGGTH